MRRTWTVLAGALLLVLAAAALAWWLLAPVGTAQGLRPPPQVEPAEKQAAEKARRVVGTDRRPAAEAAESAGGGAPSPEQARDGQPSPELEALLPPHATIFGVVRDRAGAPLAEARVWDRMHMSGELRDRVTPASTGTDGGYLLRVFFAGEVDLQCTRVGYAFETAAFEVALGDRIELDFELGPGLSISGRVVDDTGAPVAGARVAALPRRDGVTGRAPQFAETDAAGGFVAEGLDPGEARVWATHPDYPRGSPRAHVEAQAGDTGIELVLSRGAGAAGVVLDPEGLPTAGASVVALQGGEPCASTTADEEGSFRLRGLPTGQLVVVASHRALADSEALELELEQGEVVEGLELRLQPGGQLVGRVVDARGGGLGDVWVSALAVGGAGEHRSDDRERGSSSGEDGGLVIDGLDPTRLHGLTAALDGWVADPHTLGPYPVGGDPFTVVMVAPAIVRGRVLDQAGAPVAARLATTSTAASTGEDGAFELRLAPGAHQVTCTPAQPFRQVRRTLIVTAGEILEGQDFVVERGAVVTGMVVDERGAPVPGAHAWLSLEDVTLARTNEAGAFTLPWRDAGVGVAFLQVRATDFIRPEPIQARAGEHHVIRLSRGLMLVGRAVDPAGQPVADFEVRVQRRIPQGIVGLIHRPVSSPDGTFRIPGVPREATLVIVGAPGLVQAHVELSGLPETGEHDVGDVVLGAGIVVRGWVLLTSGEPAAGAEVALVQDGIPIEPPLAPRAGTLPHGRADASGRFELSEAPAARLDIAAALPGAVPVSQPIDLRNGAAPEVTLILDSGGTLLGSVRDSAGAPRVGAKLRLRATFDLRRTPAGATTDAQGNYTFSGLAPGLYEVRVEMGGEQSSTGGGWGSSVGKSVLVHADAPARCDLVLPALCHVTGRVRGFSPGVLTDSLLAFMTDSSMFTTTLTDDGRFDLHEVVPGTYTVTIGHSVYRTAVVPAAVEATVDFALEGGGVTGSVLDAEGSPVARGAVLLRAVEAGDGTPGAFRRAPIGSDGTFQIERVDAGRHRAHALVFGQGQSQAVDVEVGPVGQTELTLQLAAGGAILLSITAPGGESAPAAEVTLIDESGAAVYAVVTPAAGGMTRISGVPPGTVRAHAVLAGVGVGDSGPIQMPATGEAAEALQLHPFGRPLWLQVTHDGAPLGSAPVRVSLAGGSFAPLVISPLGALARTDADGRLQLRDLAAGAYVLEAQASSTTWSGAFQIPPGASPLAATVEVR